MKNRTHHNDNKDDRIIKLLVEENPKRPKSRAYNRFAILMKHDGETVENLKKEEGHHPNLDKIKGWITAELRWATKLGLIKLSRKYSGRQQKAA